MSGNIDLFTTTMRKATRQVHSVSDALVNAKFALSLRDETVWGGGLFTFYHVFAFIEDAKERLDMEDFNFLFVNKVIYRKKAFEADLNHYLGPDWKCIEKSSALEKYLEHLRDLEMNKPFLLMAYFYHLYMGLLSGGQILAKKRKMFGDKNAAYKDQVTDFSGHDISQLKIYIRAVMNEIAGKFSAEEREAFLEESNQVFLLNNTIVDSVSGQNKVVKNILFKAGIVSCFVVGIFIAVKLHK